MRLILFLMNGTLLGRKTSRAAPIAPVVNALAKAGIELGENGCDLPEAEGEGALAPQLAGKPLCSLCPSSVCILIGEQMPVEVIGHCDI